MWFHRNLVTKKKRMADTEKKIKIEKPIGKDDSEETIKKCDGKEFPGIFKLNGWKTTLLIVLVRESQEKRLI